MDKKMALFDQKTGHLDKKMAHLDQEIGRLDKKIAQFLLGNPYICIYNCKFFMKQKTIKIPRDVEFIGKWEDYKLPQGHVIVDKGITGCGYTEFCLTNDTPIILCSPRKLLLENKASQHEKDINILYLKNDFDDSQNLKKTLENHILTCLGFKLVPKILVTYDSCYHIINHLRETNNLCNFFFVIDEFQSIFLDSYFKCEVEFNFVNWLQDCPNVVYLSATPMLEKYLLMVDEFKDLEYEKLDWSDSMYVDKVRLERKYTKNPTYIECANIVKQYLLGNYPNTVLGSKVYFSHEAVFYLNSIEDIIRVIKKVPALRAENTNVICADNEENEKRLKKLKRGISIGHVPVPQKGEVNKTFTFCTKAVYIGADFYSDCAATYIFSDPNIETLALDIAIDLPQILGRQRNKVNPFKNIATIFYKTTEPDKIFDRNEFDRVQKKRQDVTNGILREFQKISDDVKSDFIDKFEDSIKLVHYVRDFIAISGKTGEPVYNRFIEIANERAWEVSQKDYQDEVAVKRAFNESGFGFSKDDEEIVTIFLENYFNKTSVFAEKMKLLCNFLDENQGNKDILDLVYVQLVDRKYWDYYKFYGTKGCKAVNYREASLKRGFLDYSKQSELEKVMQKEFQLGHSYSKKFIKDKLKEIYDKIGIVQKTPKASNLKEFFNLQSTNVKDKKTGKIEHGFKLISKL